MNVRRLFAVFALLAVGCGAAACIIGPKQDDPAEDRGIEDVGVGVDSGAFTSPDSAIAQQDSAQPPPSEGRGRASRPRVPALQRSVSRRSSAARR